MTSPKDDVEIEVPSWDVALASLARDEYKKNQRPLTLEDFQHLAKEYTIRLDDIMVTMFELVIQGHWSYAGPQQIERSTLNELYVNGRLHADDLAEFTGEWSYLDN